MWSLVHERKDFVSEEPKDPGAEATPAQLKKYEIDYKEWQKDNKQHKKDKAKVFRIIMGQCLTAMKNKLEGLQEYKEYEKQHDVAGLLSKMRDLVYTTDGVQYEYWTLQAVMRKMLTLRQEDKESLASFFRRFISQVEVTEDVWGSLIPTM